MRKIRYFILMALFSLGITACQDDLINNTSSGVDKSKPIKVEVKLGVPESMKVEITRADNSYSVIETLRLYIFDNKGNLIEQPQDVEATSIREDNTGHYYTARNVTLYQGSQTVYAVANANTEVYWQDPTNALDAAASQGKTTFLETMYDLQNSFLNSNYLPTFTSEIMPLSGEGEIEVSGDENNPSVNGQIELRRPVAKVIFNFAEESQTQTGNPITFTPQYYGVYKVAGRSFVWNSESERNAIGDEYFYNTPNTQAIHFLEDGVYIPENLQTGTTCESYGDREDWTGEPGAADDEKEWTNAPQNATYIVVKGTYVETDKATGNLVRQADVSYTVHLGDWSKGDYNDFSVRRNYIYTYNITVEGVDKIRVEAEAKEDSDDFQDAAEGDVIDVTAGSEVFNVDAHYEQVYVEYDLTDVANQVMEKFNEAGNEQRIEDLIANSFILSIHTPMNRAGATNELLRPFNNSTDETGKESMKNLDWSWIEMYSQSEEGISSYTTAKQTQNENYLLNPWEACRKMGQAVEKLTQNENQKPTVDNLRIEQKWENDEWHYVAYFTIFVGENFYTHDLDGNPVDWSDFTRVDPRTFMIATDIQVSPDGNSSYATARTYISQASILTFYNPESADNTNALGIESYNEHGIITGFGNPDLSSYQRGEEDTFTANGRANMLRNTRNSRSTDGRYPDINFEHIGYTSSNVTSGNTWPNLTESEKINAAYKACLSRNRDLDGNGSIDDDEVYWYLPARSQYLRMGIGANSLGDYKLYVKNDDTKPNSYPGGYVKYGALYYSNTPENNSSTSSWELYWGMEIGSYGSNTMSGEAQIRCVRNLPSKEHVEQNDDPNGDDALALPVHGGVKKLNANNYIFDFENRLDGDLHRVSVQERPYNNHVETASENRLPVAFVVSKNYVRGTSTVTEGWSSSTRDNPCTNYYETSADRGKWRVPNLSELTVMSTVADDINLSNQDGTLCSTQFSESDLRIGFRYNGKMISAWGTGDRNKAGYVRCVRDATPEEIAEVRPQQ